MDVQIFGVKNDADTRKALRFFKERRIKAHFVDFKIRGPSKGELRRFVQKFGADALIDRGSKRFKAMGLSTAHYGDDRWIEETLRSPDGRIHRVDFESGAPLEEAHSISIKTDTQDPALFTHPNKGGD